MPAISIDLENAAGTRQGAGPIVSATNLKTVQRLSKAGTIAFDVPCADPKTADIVAKRVARPHTLRNGATVALPAGIVDSITVRERSDDPPILTIAGDDILSELVNRRVLGLDISDGSGGPIAIATALTSIMALAPSGWTLDTSTYTTSGATVYHKFGNETVLAALIWVANAVGEQFRLGSGKQIVWLYHDQPSSGLRAVKTGDPVAMTGNTSLLLIDTLEEVADTHTVVTRIYPYGAGNAEARVTLAHATWTAPAGYTIDTTNNFIKVDAADTANRIDDVATYSSIAEIGTTGTDQTSASNQIAVTAYEDLRRRIVAVKTYRVTVTKLEAAIDVGSTINVSYRKTIDGYVAVNIAADLVVMEVSTSYDASGIPSAALTVATVDRYPVTGAASVVQSLASGQQSASGNIQKATRSLAADTAATAATFTSAGIRAHVTNSANQSIPNSAFTAVTFDTEREDTDTIHDISTDPTRLTCRTAGAYLVGGNVSFAANATGQRVASVFLNGSSELSRVEVLSAGGAIVTVIPATPVRVTLAVGDYVELQVFQASGGALNVVKSANYSPEFWLVRLP